ncbi:LytR/AlgR family response regulator transcription factor [Aquimarina algicola]|uniref:Response regulator transcription factor n=1 Tax=Aquimarina algicola TaxID=2589995 RepID=A0A504JD84_9FLAO|nr:LytTR family DNA-binding domain-containing protein [Aquimarina algicola]TPN88827.1 response regulator transcription factor [Aquimarina algicola]
MKKLNCLIIDDELYAREGIANYCKEVSFLNIIALCKNVLQANHHLEKNQIDLIFLDINMPMIQGIDWLKELKNAPSIIITTAYEKYALESFEYNVLDYLVKPISLKRFLQAVNKVANYHSNLTKEKFLFFKIEKHLKKINLKDVLFVEAMQNYVKIVTTDEDIIIKMPLKKLKNQLPIEDFIQTHKSYIISKNKVDKIIENTIVIGTYHVPVSVRLKSSVFSSFKLEV